MPGRRVKFPDDPDIRVRLSEDFRAALEQRDPEEIARRLAENGAARLHPSSIKRYAQGRIAPRLRVARKLAKLLDWPLTEAVVGYSERHARPTLDWGRVLLYARHFRQRALTFLEMFRAIVVANTHFGFPNDAVRGFRHQVRPPGNGYGYACFEVVLDEAIHEGSVDLVISYCLFEQPRLFIDFGTITVTPSEVVLHEIWTNRGDRADRTLGEQSFWIATWVDGKAVDFVLRSATPFSVSDGMLWEKTLPPGPRTLIRFKAGPIHKYKLAEDDSAESGN